MIYDLFAAQAAITPNKVALVCGEESVSYRGLLHHVDEYASRLSDRGINCAVSVMRSNLDGVITLLGMAKIKGTVYPVPHGTTADAATDLERKVFPEKQSGDAPFLLLNTSGTTGDPKLISITQETKILRINQFKQLYGVHQDDTVLVGTPLHASMAQRLVLMSLLYGATAHLVSEYSPYNWMLAADKCSIICGVPQQLKLMQDGLWPRAELVLSASAPRGDDSRLASNLMAQDIDYKECYGASEVAIATSGLVLAEGVGVPVVDCRISDGEIQVKSPLMHSGYYMRPDLTAASLTEDGYFKTGDSGFFDENGVLHLDGRLNDRIKVGGYTVWPADIEAVVLKMPGVIDCAAFGVPHAEFGEAVAVAIVGDVSRHQLQRFCLGRLSDAQIPRLAGKTDVIPRTETGKIIRRKIVCSNLE